MKQMRLSTTARRGRDGAGGSGRQVRQAVAAARAVATAALLTAAGWLVVTSLHAPSRGEPGAAGRPSWWAALSVLGLRDPGTAGSIRSLEEAIAYCEQGLARARATAAARPRDPMAHLRLAGLETHRCSLLALLAYERQRDPRKWDEEHEYPRWRARYLREDPDRALTRAARAARTALRVDAGGAGTAMPPEARREAYLILAHAHKGLGDHIAEAEALAAAARREPHQADLWMRAADAYARARRFSRAEAAMARALAEEQ